MDIHTLKNAHVVLKSRPGPNNEPAVENFEYRECPTPDDDLGGGQVLIKTFCLSVDPLLRCVMNEDTGVHYAQPWNLGDTCSGASGVGVIIKSHHAEYLPGDLMELAFGWPWKLYFVQDLSSPSEFRKIDKTIFGPKPSLAMSGLPALSALLGLWEKGHIASGTHQTLVVSGAAGATGSLAGQMGRLLGAERVVGICGTAEKCEWLTTELKFDGAICYKTANISQELKDCCPDGIDVYFDNVGGYISEEVIKQMNVNSHVVLCGQISQYNKDVPYPPPIPENIQRIIEETNITRERFLVLNYKERFEEAMSQFIQWLLAGKVHYKETVTEGLQNTGAAFVSMMKGGNIGRQIVQVSDTCV